MTWVKNASAEVDGQSEYPTILAVCITVTALMTFIVLLRAYVRVRVVHSLGTDDYITFFSAICAIIYSGICIAQSRLGLGLPLLLRPKLDLDEYSTINFAGRPFYMAGIAGFKVALCFAYLRITKNGVQSRYRTIIWAVMSFTIVSHLTGTLVLIFQCRPVSKSWRPKTPGHCLPNDSTFYALAAISILCDIVIFTLPIPLFVRLQINRRRKMGLIFTFLLGLFTTVCSVMRMVQIVQIAKTGNSTMLVLWGVVEMNVGILLTCLPTLAPLFVYFQKMTRKGTHSGAYTFGTSKHGTAIRMQPYPPHQEMTTGVQPAEAWAGSNSSQEDILPYKKGNGSADDGMQNIMKRTDVDVTITPRAALRA